ncbi:MAG TPA: ABC transporter permease [Solirubrobacteraceae bacterium]|jgi:ABC-2 type transport system permease protein|nr:ABC transporter permease [Solirubrobacteraceae bacterium]
MSRALTAWSAFAMIMRRDLHVYLSYRTRLVSQVLTAIFSLTLFYYVSRLVRLSEFRSPAGYFSFVVIGIALVSVMYSCFLVPELVRQELVAGTFDRLLLSPFGAVRSVVAMTLFPLVLSFALAAITIGLGCAIFGMRLHWSTVPVAIPVMALALLAFLPLGLLFAALAIVVKQGAVGTSWVIAAMALTSGVYFPLAVLPQWMQTIGGLQPFTPATSVLRHLLVDSPIGGSVSSALLKLVGFAVVLLPASIALLSAAIRVGQRRGTIIEY